MFTIYTPPMLPDVSNRYSKYFVKAKQHTLGLGLATLLKFHLIMHVLSVYPLNTLFTLRLEAVTRNSCLEVFYKKDLQKNSMKNIFGSLIYKLAGLEPVRMFSCDFWEIFQNSFYISCSFQL